MNKRGKYLVKNIGILTISNFASKFLVFLLVPLYTSILSTNEVGLYDLVVSTVSLAFPILSLNIVDALTRFLMDKSKKKEEVALIGFQYTTLSIIPIVFALIILPQIEFFSLLKGYEGFILVYYILICYNQYLIQFAKGMEMVHAMGISGVIGTSTMLFANIIFLVVMNMGLRGFFLANILGMLFPIAFLIKKTRLWRYLGVKVYNHDLKKDMLKFCTPLIVTAVGWWVNSTADKYVVSFICGIAANGLLSVSYKIPAVMNTFQQIFIQAWQISAVKEYGEANTREFYGRVFVIQNVAMAIGCSLLILLSKPIGKILYQHEFYSAWQYVPYLVIASVINCAAGFLGPILSARKESKPMAISAIYGVVSNIILNLFLVRNFGIQGATIATLISSFIIYFVRKKAVGGDITIEKYTKVFVIWGILCVQATLEIYTTMWYIEILLIVIIIIMNKKLIGNVIEDFSKIRLNNKND